MRTLSLPAACGLLAVCLIMLASCDKSKTNATAGRTTASHDHGHSHGHHHHHGHSHRHGPHDGHIVDLGSEDYHAEITHDEASQRVGVYVLGADAASPAPVDATSVTIYVLADNEPAQYELPAAARPGEAEGESSYFEITSEPLQKIISGQSESPGAEARLSILIDGMPYVGMIATEDHRQSDIAIQGHSHADDDTLVWRKEISKQGYHIELGHHGVLLLAGAEVEPAVQITRNGEPVDDAKVANTLLAADGQTVLAEEASAVYEPPAGEEPAHYAQGALKIPAGTRDAIIRFRIMLPEDQDKLTFDLPVAVK